MPGNTARSGIGIELQLGRVVEHDRHPMRTVGMSLDRSDDREDTRLDLRAPDIEAVLVWWSEYRGILSREHRNGVRIQQGEPVRPHPVLLLAVVTVVDPQALPEDLGQAEAQLRLGLGDLVLGRRGAKRGQC